MIAQHIGDPRDQARAADRQLREMERHNEAVTREREIRGQAVVTTDHRSPAEREFGQLRWLNL
jgi:hypothetical protein